MTRAPFRGVIKPRDRSAIPPNQFWQLENVRLTLPSGYYSARPGVELVSAVPTAAIDGIFDAGDRGTREEA